MTIHPLLVIGNILLVVGLALAYIGAATRATILQASLDNLWPFVRAVGAVFQAEAEKGGEKQ